MKERTVILFVYIVFLSLNIVAQRIETISATYTFYAPKNMSVEEAERVALERAKIKALADVFGTLITQSNSTLMSSDNGDSDVHFFSLSGSNVKGEWIETIGEPQFSTSFESRCVVVVCTVKGRAKEIIGNSVDYEAIPLRNAPNLNYNTTQFYDGDDLYLYFKAPIAGYLNVFLLNKEEDNAFCLLPYKKSKDGSFVVEADAEYYLFSKDKDTENKSVIDEYTLSSSSAKEFNELVIIFSPKEFNKAKLKIQKEVTVPKSTSISKFNEWLSKLKSKNNNITTSIINLTISKR